MQDNWIDQGNTYDWGENKDSKITPRAKWIVPSILTALLIRVYFMFGWYHPDLAYIHNIDSGLPSNYYQPLVYHVFKLFHLLMNDSGFWMKAPYLFLEAPIIYILLKLKDERLLYLWLFNPIVIYSCYIFGQYRMLTALITWVFLWLLWNNRKSLAFVAFGLLCSVEIFPWVLFPVVIFTVSKDWLEREWLAIIVLFIFVLFSGYDIQILSQPIKGIFASHQEWNILVKILEVFGLLSVWWISLKSKATVRLCTVAILIIYATSPMPVHYLMWVLPFLLFIKKPLSCG